MDEFIQFLKENKKLIFYPTLVAIILVIILILIGSDSAIAPFVYSLF